MEKSRSQEIEKKIPFAHSVLMAIGEKKLTKEQVHENYVRIRPGTRIGKLIYPPADLHTVDVYLKIFTNYEYVNQEIAPWSENGKAQVILYFLSKKGREVLNGKLNKKK